VDKKKIVCQSCTYAELRNAALQRLMATNTNPNIRRQAIVGVMQKTRQQARQPFEYYWG
jgi:hypothetical protein